ncbi:SOS response-associated peptidase [Bacillus sp. Marseille-P3661]|uniref:SOS response-associated peptidase n=1 Tax=Bacillus sp. Marseille-P3661 TaxID=1936234 RepID=UPI000C84307F|nr:SOS response-associated peptidase [Bacillus sp. Marseille-P3661]
MCGRFTLSIPLDEIIDFFDLVNGVNIMYEPSYNIAPSQDVLAVVSDGENLKGGLLKWGLVPSWSKDPSVGYKMINARAETLEQKVSFRKLLRQRRCIIVADGFYEWKKDSNGEKQPFRMTLTNNNPIAFAGLWDRSLINDIEYTTCTIITTSSNPLMKPIHDRMPVILSEDATAKWLDRRNQDPIELKKLLVPFDANEMKAYKVSSIVNTPKNNNIECIEPLA